MGSQAGWRTFEALMLQSPKTLGWPSPLRDHSVSTGAGSAHPVRLAGRAGVESAVLPDGTSGAGRRKSR